MLSTSFKISNFYKCFNWIWMYEIDFRTNFLSTRLEKDIYFFLNPQKLRKYKR